MDLTLLIMFAILVVGLMIRFVLCCINRIKVAKNGFQVFSAFLLLVMGFLLFPITLMFQSFDIVCGD